MELRGKGIMYFFKRDWRLYLLLVFPIFFFILFKYIPMYGILMSFQDYNMFQGIFGSPWVGLQIFHDMFNQNDFYRALRNTFMLNALDLVVGFPAPLILAILLNEMRSKLLKRTSQTILYFPHFLSWVIIGGISVQLFADKGLANLALKSVGVAAIPFLTNKWWWLISYIGIGVWQSAGWGTILYLAAITGINPELYEAADIDGATRFKKIWYVLIPCIKPTIITLLILNLGRITSIGFDRPFVMQNSFVNDFGEVISTYVYKVGLQSGQFSFATAVGLFQSLVGLVFLLCAEFTARRLGERGLW